MSILALVARRALLAIPMLFGIVTATFLVTRILPGDPVAHLAGSFATEETVQQLRAQYGFEKPLLEQYVDFLGNIVQGDLGTSVLTGAPVFDDLMRTLPSTLELITLTLIVACTLGITAGVTAAINRGRKSDSAIRGASFVLLAIPEFWFALVALFLLFFKLGIAPAPVGQIGLTDERPKEITNAVLLDSILTLNWTAFKAAAYHAMLPVLTFGLILSAPIARLMRSSMIETLEADFIRFGRSLGLPRKVLRRYATRAALPPVMTMAAMIFTTLVGSAVLVEIIFSWGGAAQYAARAVEYNDYNAVQGFVLIAGTISVVVFVLVDILYMVIDPRIRIDSPGGGFLARLRALPAGLRARLRPRVGGEELAPLSAPLAVAPPIEEVAPRRTPATVARAVVSIPAKLAGLIVSAWHGLRRPGLWNRSLVAGTSIILFFLIASFVIPAVWPDDPMKADPGVALQSPSARHPFGTDASGFDVFVRVFTAPQTDLKLAAFGVLIGAFIGIGLGIAAGFSRGWFGEIVMRITDVVQAFPMFILALVLVSLSGNNIKNVVFALAFVNIPIFLRLVRSRVLTVRELRFIEAAEALGNSRGRTIVRHVLPNAIGPAIVQFGLSLGYGILAVAGLAFLGVGVSVPTPEWGSMILTGRSNILTGQWWTVVFPGIALAIAVAGFNLLSEGIEQSRELSGSRRRPAAPPRPKATPGVQRSTEMQEATV